VRPFKPAQMDGKRSVFGCTIRRNGLDMFTEFCFLLLGNNQKDVCVLCVCSLCSLCARPTILCVFFVSACCFFLFCAFPAASYNLPWSTWIAPLASLAALARSLRSPYHFVCFLCVCLLFLDAFEARSRCICYAIFVPKSTQQPIQNHPQIDPKST